MVFLRKLEIFGLPCHEGKCSEGKDLLATYIEETLVAFELFLVHVGSFYSISVSSASLCYFSIFSLIFSYFECGLSSDEITLYVVHGLAAIAMEILFPSDLNEESLGEYLAV